MDKFGIFNLLNSFLRPLSNSSAQSENTLDGNSSTPPDFLNGILSSLNNNTSADNKEQSSSAQQVNQPPRERKTATPLQRQMLSTMYSHDELIRRISKNQKNNP